MLEQCLSQNGNGEIGTVKGMGMDGRVRVVLDDEQAEDKVWLATKHAAVKDLTRGGVWLDLTKIEHAFVEQMVVLQEVQRNRRRELDATVC